MTALHIIRHNGAASVIKVRRRALIQGTERWPVATVLVIVTIAGDHTVTGTLGVGVVVSDHGTAGVCSWATSAGATKGKEMFIIFRVRPFLEFVRRAVLCNHLFLLFFIKV